MKEAISDAENKKFSEFNKKVKASLEDKLRNNPTVKAKSEEMGHLEKMKDTFAKIKSKTKEVPAEPEKKELIEPEKEVPTPTETTPEPTPTED